MKVIIFLFLFGLAAVNCGQPPTKQEFKCDPKDTYIENNCNTCICSSDKKLVCTLKFCPDTPHKCEVGLMWAKPPGTCNVCWCVKDKGIVCTDHAHCKQKQ